MVSRRSVWRGASRGKPDRGAIPAVLRRFRSPICAPGSCYHPRNRMNSARLFLASVEGICMVEQGVGARLLRKEDDRLMRGRGEFVADIRLAGHAGCGVRALPAGACADSRHIGSGRNTSDSVFTAADLDGVKPIRAVSALPGFKISEQPVLATEKLRQVGELVAMCVGRTRAEAEDIAASVELDLEELPAVHDMLQARAARLGSGPRVTGETMSFLETFVDVEYREGIRRPDQGHARDPHRAAIDGAAGGARRGGDMEQPARAAHRLYRGADAPYQSHRTCRDVSGSTTEIFASSRRMSAAASATREFCCPRKSACRG